MDYLFGKHARARMAEREITEAMALQAITNSEHQHPQQRNKIVYHAIVQGRPIAVVVAYDNDPPFIVTVMDDWSAP